MDNLPEKVEKIEKVPMSNDDILKYFPEARIIANNELKDVQSIDDVLDKNKDYDGVIILYLSGENEGHWTSLCKYGNSNNPKDCFIEFFDSYGENPTTVYEYADKEIRDKLGNQKDYVLDLLKACPYNVIYNNIQYQSDKRDIMTCGRHCCFRLYNLIKYCMGLTEYYNYMQCLKKKTGLNYDQIVSININE